MTEVFDGKSFQEKKLQETKNKIQRNSLKLQLVSILVGDDKASKIYTNLKKHACEYVGIHMNVLEFGKEISFEILKDRILELNSDKNVNGIMIQLPLPENLKSYTQELINLIDGNKDVDGMREDSKFTPATIKAVLEILKITNRKGSVAVVGSKGAVGRVLTEKLKATGFDIGDNLKNLVNFDVVISATGKPSLIKPEMIKENSALIDVGAPRPEFDERCYEKASFYTPVPGGVGPVTIASLTENIANSI